MDTKFSTEQIRQVLGTAEGRQLIAMLAKNGNLQTAANAFRQGNMAAAQEALKPTLQTQEAEALLKKLNER